MAIQFGTSGWRAVIADEFTFAGVRSVTSAICSDSESRKRDQNQMIGGYDTRFPGEQFAEECVDAVGFKFIGEPINEDKIVIGVEESAGLSIKGHYPEKDGILACLLAAEAIAARGASLTEELEDLYPRAGKLDPEGLGFA